MTFVEIDKGYFVVAEKVIAVKAINDKKCSLFLAGQSAMEGFVVDKGARELVDEICTAWIEDNVEDEDDGEDE